MNPLDPNTLELLREQRRLAAEVHSLRQRLGDVERSNQLGRGSVIGAETLDVYDDDENLSYTVGEQFDGTVIGAPLRGPEPPIPTPPVVTPGLRSVTVHWDGLWEPIYADDGVTVIDDQVVAPMDFSRVEIHASEDPFFTAEFANTIVGTFETPRGGDQMVPISTVDVDYTIKLVCRTLPGNRGDASDGVLVQAEDIQLSDGEPPATSPTPNAFGGVGAIYLRWAAVPNEDPVTYKVYGSSLAGFIPSEATFLGEVQGTAMTVKRLNDGDGPEEELSYVEPSYFRILAVDPDGPAVEPDGVTLLYGNEVSAKPVQINSPDIAATAVHAEHLSGAIISGDLFSGEIVLGSRISTGSIDDVEGSPTYGQVIGQRVDLSPAGLSLTAPNGNVLVNLTTDENESSKFSGRLEATELRVTGGMSIESQANEIAKDASLALSTGISNPPTSPTVVANYFRVKFDTTTLAESVDTAYGDFGPRAFNPANAECLGWHEEYNYWIVAERIDGGNKFRIWHFQPDGQLGLALGGEPLVYDRLGWADVRGLWGRAGFLNTSVFYLVPSLFTGGKAMQVADKVTTSSAYVTADVGAPQNTAQRPFGFYDPILDRFCTAENLNLSSTSKVVRIRRFTIPATGGFDGPEATQESVINSPHLQYAGTEFAGLIPAIFPEIGPSKRYAAAYYNNTAQARFMPITGGLLDDHAERFSVYAPPRGFAHDGTHFWSLGSDGYITRYENWTWTSGGDNIYGAVSWLDDDTDGTPTPPAIDGKHQSKLGPKVTFAAVKRARLAVTLPQVPDKGGVDDPNKVRLWMKRAAATPADAEMIYQTETANPLGPATIILPELATTNPPEIPEGAPTVNNFPGANPGKIFAARISTTFLREEFYVDGEGNGWWHRIAPPGLVLPYAGAGLAGVAPPGWLWCDGALYSRAAYPALFAAIGTTYNVGGESATDFRVPDTLRRVIVGTGPGVLLGRTEGIALASASSRTFAHNHTTPNHTHTDSFTLTKNQEAKPVGTGGGAVLMANGTALSGGITSSGGGNTGNSVYNDMPHIAMNCIIKT